MGTVAGCWIYGWWCTGFWNRNCSEPLHVLHKLVSSILGGIINHSRVISTFKYLVPLTDDHPLINGPSPSFRHFPRILPMVRPLPSFAGSKKSFISLWTLAKPDVRNSSAAKAAYQAMEDGAERAASRPAPVAPPSPTAVPKVVRTSSRNDVREQKAPLRLFSLGFLRQQLSICWSSWVFLPKHGKIQWLIMVDHRFSAWSKWEEGHLFIYVYIHIKLICIYIYISFYFICVYILLYILYYRYYIILYFIIIYCIVLYYIIFYYILFYFVYMLLCIYILFIYSLYNIYILYSRFYIYIFYIIFILSYICLLYIYYVMLYIFVIYILLID